MNSTTAQTLAIAWDDITQTPDVEEGTRYHLGLWQVEYEGYTYAIGTEVEAKDAAAMYIKGSLWAFNPEFLCSYTTGLMRPHWLKEIIGERCEDANDDISDMVADDLERLIDDAISADGIGHFLCSYDGESEEVTSPSGDRLVIVRVE